MEYPNFAPMSGGNISLVIVVDNYFLKAMSRVTSL